MCIDQKSGKRISKLKELIVDELGIGTPEISDDDDLFQLGLNSISSIELIVSIEEAFDIEFEDEYLNKETLRSIKTINEYLITKER